MDKKQRINPEIRTENPNLRIVIPEESNINNSLFLLKLPRPNKLPIKTIIDNSLKIELGSFSIVY